MKKFLVLIIILAAVLSTGCDPETPEEQNASVYVNKTSIDPGDICPNGGVAIEMGIDENNNGLLEPEEVDNTEYVCNGTDGQDGVNSLVKISAELPGENCSCGGQKIETGLDENTNGILDAEEVDNTSYLCNLLIDCDNDGIVNDFDNCSDVANSDQTDQDGDDIGDVCDNCTNIPNADQADQDNDGLGNLCDNCPDMANIDQTDLDSDGAGDLCDNCPDVFNPDQSDINGNGIGDACDPASSFNMSVQAVYLDNDNLIPTSADMVVVGDGLLLINTSLAPGVNTINITDGYTVYEVAAAKIGFEQYSVIFSGEELKAFTAANPLQIELMRYYEFWIEVYANNGQSITTTSANLQITSVEGQDVLLETELHEDVNSVEFKQGYYLYLLRISKEGYLAFQTELPYFTIMEYSEGMPMTVILDIIQ